MRKLESLGYHGVECMKIGSAISIQYWCIRGGWMAGP